MKSFRQFILAEGSGHLTHVEDSVLYSGVDGARKAIQTLKSVRDSLTGKGKKVSVTVKWDGAPAIFCGIDPADGKFFVAKKSIFNKVPEVYKSPADIDAAITSGDLSNKMKVALAELSKLGIRGIIQGDIMFTEDTVKRQTIGGQEYITFHPNTIVYAVPADSEIGQKVSVAKIGVVFHTSYTGKLGSLEAVPGVNTKSMKQIPSVWWQTADLKSMSSETSMPLEEVNRIDDLLKQADQTLSKVSPNTLRALQVNSDLAQDLETYANSKVRSGQEIGDAKKHVIGLMNWMKARFDKEAAEKKTVKGKEAVDARRQARMEFFSGENMNNLILIFTLQQILVDAKKLLISKLNQLSGVNTFLKTKAGYEKTGQEGYVVGDPLGGNTVKLVDRLGFSRANFSPDVVKGFEKNR